VAPAERLFSRWRDFLLTHSSSLRAQTMATIEVSGDGWAMVGDSAGLVDPITGEGLYYALRSAELCAEALLAHRPEDYELRLEEESFPS